jgi:hypothetical protein
MVVFTKTLEDCSLDFTREIGIAFILKELATFKVLPRIAVSNGEQN